MMPSASLQDLVVPAQSPCPRTVFDRQRMCDYPIVWCGQVAALLFRRADQLDPAIQSKWITPV
jgi:hypothetical protein